jgi:hypothetical protein
LKSPLVKQDPKQVASILCFRTDLKVQVPPEPASQANQPSTQTCARPFLSLNALARVLHSILPRLSMSTSYTSSPKPKPRCEQTRTGVRQRHTSDEQAVTGDWPLKSNERGPASSSLKWWG